MSFIEPKLGNYAVVLPKQCKNKLLRNYKKHSSQSLFYSTNEQMCKRQPVVQRQGTCRTFCSPALIRPLLDGRAAEKTGSADKSFECFCCCFSRFLFFFSFFPFFLCFLFFSFFFSRWPAERLSPGLFLPRWRGSSRLLDSELSLEVNTNTHQHTCASHTHPLQHPGRHMPQCIVVWGRGMGRGGGTAGRVGEEFLHDIPACSVSGGDSGRDVTAPS